MLIYKSKRSKKGWTRSPGCGRMKQRRCGTVDEKTTIAHGLHATDDSAGYDAACKRVLSEKAILGVQRSCVAGRRRKRHQWPER